MTAMKFYLLPKNQNQNRMSNQIRIFHSILNQYLETFSSHFNLILESADNDSKNSDHFHNSAFLKDIFPKFPRIIPVYSEILNNMTSIAMNDTDEIMIFLTKAMKELLFKDSLSIFAPIQKLCVNFDSNNELHLSILYFFGLFLISDLICQIVATVNFQSVTLPNYSQISSTTMSNSNSSQDLQDKSSEEPYSEGTDEQSSSRTSKETKPRSKTSFFQRRTFSLKKSTSPQSKSDKRPQPYLYASKLKTQIALTSSTISSLAKAGYNLVIATNTIDEIHQILIKQWSVIFSILSETNFDAIYQTYTLFPSSMDLTYPLILYRFFRLDADEAIGPYFFKSLIETLKTMLKKKTLNNTILYCVSTMLITLPYDEDIYHKLYNLVYPLRTDKVLADGAAHLITSLCIRYTKPQQTFAHFFQKRVLAACGDRAKTQTCIGCFLTALMGRNVVPELLFWVYGNNPRSTPLSFVKFGSYSFLDPAKNMNATLHTAFMNYFFVKSDFSICPVIFVYTIVILASIDFQYFLDNIVPRFIELDSNDARFIVFLSVVPIVNSQDFYMNCISRVKYEEIQQLNSVIRKKIIDSYLQIEPPNDAPHGVCIREINFLIDSLSEEADQKLAAYLEEWGLSDYFKPLYYSYKKCKHSSLSMNLAYSLLGCISFVMTDEDYKNDAIIRTTLKFSCSINNGIASRAYRFCADDFLSKIEPQQFIGIAYSMTYDPESDFIMQTLILELCKKRKLAKEKNDEDFIRMFESVAIVIQSSVLPALRSLGREILHEAHELLGDRSLISLLERDFPTICKLAKQKMFVLVLPNKPHNKLPPGSDVPLFTVSLSHYYGVWIFYFCEVLNFLILRNFTPFFNFVSIVRERIKQGCLVETSRWTYADVVILMSTQFKASRIVDSVYYDSSRDFEPFDFENFTDHSQSVCTYLNKLLHKDDPEKVELAFNAIQHLHFTLLPPVIDVLTKVPQKYLPRACAVVCYIIRLPEITHKFFKKNALRLISFSTEVQFYILQSDLSSTRQIHWTDELEERLVKHAPFLINFCMIIIKTIRETNGELNLMEWPTTTREIINRLFLNWVTTKSPKLESLRQYTDAAINAIISVGPSLTSVPHFSDNILCYFAEKAKNYQISALYTLLHFHFEMLFDIYITACITLPRVYGDVYFSCITDCLISFSDNEHRDFILKNSGKLLFLSSLFIFLKHPKACLMIQNLIQVIKEIPRYEYLNEHYHQLFPQQEKIIHRDIPKAPTKSGSISNLHSFNQVLKDRKKIETLYLNHKNASISFAKPEKKSTNSQTTNPIDSWKIFEKIPGIFQFDTEAVFDAFFNAIKLPNLHVNTVDMIESIHLWVPNIRLLPNRPICANEVPPSLNFFTPHEFLAKLKETTELLEYEAMRAFVEIWSALSLMPDHIDLIPMILSEWENTPHKRKMFQLICETNTVNVAFRIQNRYTFAYYYYVVEYGKQSFEDNQEWLGTILDSQIHNSNIVSYNSYHFAKLMNANIEFPMENMKHLPIGIIHFVFLFHDKGTRKPFSFFCNVLKIQNYEGAIPLQLMRRIVDETTKFFSHDKLEQWGDEALKWLFGCKDLKLATISFLIYNKIMKPFNNDIINTVLRVLTYHIHASMKQFVGDDSIEKRRTNTYENKITGESTENSHLNDSQSILCNFLSEAFNFIKNSLELIEENREVYLEKFFRMICPFLDCRMFVNSVLIEATPIFVEYLQNTMSKTIQNSFFNRDKNILISIIRPQLDLLKNDFESQNLLAQFINFTSSPVNSDADNNDKFIHEELLMIALPIKMLNVRAFPSVKFNKLFEDMISINECINSNSVTFVSNYKTTTLQIISGYTNSYVVSDHQNEFNPEWKKKEKIETEFFNSISPSALCKSLSHYSMMIQNSIYHLQNMLFYLSSCIVERLDKRDHENNRLALSKIYQQALRSVTRCCPNAIDFMKVISQKIPKIVSSAFYDYFEWERSIEDIDRNLQATLKKVLDDDELNALNTNVTITDCKSYASVQNFLFLEKPPQILPFSNFEKVMEGMKKVRRRKSLEKYARGNNKDNGLLKKMKKQQSRADNHFQLTSSVSFVFGEDEKDRFLNLEPINHPTELVMEEIPKVGSKNFQRKISTRRFLMDCDNQSESSEQ